MRNNKETRDSILIAMLDAHPKPKWWKKGVFPASISYCMDGGNCDCPFAPFPAIESLVSRGLVRLNQENGYVLTESKGVKVATLVWNRYCLKERKKGLMRPIPA